MTRRIGILPVSLITFLSGLAWSAPGLSAPRAAAQAASCQPAGRSNYFDGYSNQTGSNNYAGSYGTLTTQQGLLCTTDTGTNNFSTAWVMLQHPGAQDFGQVGYFETYGRNTHWFTAWQSDGQNYPYSEYDDLTDTIGAGSTYNYAATKAENNAAACHTYGHSCICFLINGQLFGISSDFPWASGVSSFPLPAAPEFEGETTYYTSDVPGTYTHAQFANLAWMSAGYVRSTDFSAFPMNPDDTNPYWYRHNTLTNLAFQIWDGTS